MQAVNLRSFRQKVKRNKKNLWAFLNKLKREKTRGLDKLATSLEPEVWKEVDCLSCANCCKSMTPTFTTKDIKRISAHFSQTPEEFRKKWLKKDRAGDMVNKVEPCQFLNLDDNKCSIYAIRPVDCSGFPHFPRKMHDFLHVHKQNVEFCPATYKMVEKMQRALADS